MSAIRKGGFVLMPVDVACDPVPDTLECRSFTVANELERMLEAYGGKLAIQKIYDAGLPCQGETWVEAIKILRERHGARMVEGHFSLTLKEANAA